MEKRKYTQKRIWEFIDLLEKRNEDCVIVGHAFFFICLLKALRKRGWKIPKINVMDYLERRTCISPT
jgi:hypothetical protein